MLWSSLAKYKRGIIPRMIEKHGLQNLANDLNRRQGVPNSRQNSGSEEVTT